MHYNKEGLIKVQAGQFKEVGGSGRGGVVRV